MSATSAQTEAIYGWLAACTAADKDCPSDGDITSPRRKRRQACYCTSDVCHCTSRKSRRHPASSPFMDNTRDQAARGRGLKRGVTTRSQGKNERLKDKSGTGPEGSSASAPAGILDANLHQLNLAGTRSTAPSELDIQTPISLSHATALTSTSISRDNASSRSHSPAKYIVDLGAAKPPIMVDTMDGAPEAIRILMDRFADVCDGIAVLPNCLKAQIKEINKREYRGLFFDDTTSATLSDKELLERLRYLQGAASRCHRLGKPEPSWGEEVFRPMLDLAVELENRDGGPVAQVENVTTAQIFPQYLVPINLQSLPFASKRVDYGIYLSQTDAQESFNREIFTKRSNNIEDHSINQAGSSNSIKWLPQLAAIECKKTLPGIDGVVQLGIWMAALRKRLEGLMKESQTPGLILKPMPCVKVEGLNWQMYWCCVGERGETMLYGPKPLGSTTDIKGMYQILKALREIVRYGRDEYWPWFRETILWES